MGQVEQATVQLTRRPSQAASGTGPAVEALRRLRLSAEDLQRLPLDARIAAIQQALGQYVPEAEHAAVASQLFGDRASLVFTRIDTATLGARDRREDGRRLRRAEPGPRDGGGSARASGTGRRRQLSSAWTTPEDLALTEAEATDRKWRN